MKELSERKKRLIAEMWQETEMSAASIAAALKVSRDTVLKYKDVWIGQTRL
jgi:hypothetical protein